MRSLRLSNASVVLVMLCTMAGCAVDSADEGPSGEDATGPSSSSSSSSDNGTQIEPPAGMLDAMTRDLHLTTAQVRDLLRVEAEAARTEPKLRDMLADTFAGAWMKKDGSRLAVGITDPAVADLVRDMGADPVLVKRNLAQLTAIKGGLDKAVARAGDDIHSWYVDVTTNTVVVSAKNPDSAVVRNFIGDSVEGVRVVESVERPRPLYDVRGGDEIILNRSALCSMGFAVNGGYVTAGHCGRTGQITQGSNWVDSGVIRGSTFPGNDWAYIETNAQWNTLGVVNNYSGGTVAVAGSQVASVGSSVCRSGRTTGWRCGVIQAQNVTINYADGPVYYATQTTTCAEGGDSGGSFISGNQAQGVTSGGSGNCTSGGTTFFQPVNPILSTFGLTLKTTGGGGAKAIVSRLNNKCIDVPGSRFDDGARLQMYTCNNTGAQQWTFVNGTLRAGGKCMDVAGANTADGTPIQITGCNGNQAQQFVLSAAGDLVSVLANKCVDIVSWNQNDGAQLIIYPCHGGNNQKWFTR